MYKSIVMSYILENGTLWQYGRKHVNSEKIPIIKVKYYFGVCDIQYLLLCLIDDYHRYKQD